MEPREGGRGGSAGFSSSEFSIMRRLVASPGSELTQLKPALEGAGRSLPGDLDTLQRRYIVDCVTFLEGERVKRLYSQSPEGRGEAFLQLLASFYEIPEQRIAPGRTLLTSRSERRRSSGT